MSNEVKPTVQQDGQDAAETELLNPFDGMYGARNGIKVPIVRRTVIKGKNKNAPYVSLDFCKLSLQDLVTAYGEKELRTLVENKTNLVARGICDEIEDNRAGYTCDQFGGDEMAEVQRWADGLVEERTPLAELKKELDGIMYGPNMDDPDTMQRFYDLLMEIKARKKARAAK